MMCLWYTHAVFLYLWFTYDLLILTYDSLMIYLWFTYDLLRLLMMILQKKKSAFCSYAEQGFEPCTFRTTAFRLTNQTASPSTMLAALTINKKSKNIYRSCSLDMQMQITHLQSGIYLGYLWPVMISSEQCQLSPRLFLMNCWLVAHLRAVLLMYHHRLPSPAPLLESHIAPGKSVFSLLMENRMVPVSLTGTRTGLLKMEVMGTT